MVWRAEAAYMRFFEDGWPPGACAVRGLLVLQIIGRYRHIKETLAERYPQIQDERPIRVRPSSVILWRSCAARL